MTARKLVRSLEFIVVSTIALFLLCLLPTTNYELFTVHADSTPSAATNYELRTTNSQLPTTIPPTSPLYTDLLVNNMFHTFSCLAAGISVIGQPCLTYQVQKNAQGVLQTVPVLSQVNVSGGALGAVSSVLALLYVNPPVKTGDYLASVGQGLGIVREAHAQVAGSGANVLSPIFKLWQVSRNISYLVMIIIFVIIGLMIMFRQKINPQTVITAQAALPGLIIGLILITFSYFLAGLLSDFAFIGTNVVGYYFQAAQGVSSPENLVDKTAHENVLQIFGRFVGIITKEDAADALSAVFDSFSDQVQGFIRLFAGVIAFQFSSQIGNAIPVVGQIAAPIIGLVTALALQTDITGIVGWVISLIAMAVLIYTMIRLLLKLINNYISIILLTVSAPFQFLVASLPGRQGIVTDWIRNMLCNILAFPAVMTVFYFVNYLMGPAAIQNSPFIIDPKQPPFDPGANFPLFGGMDLSFIRILLAFGALVATPAIPDILCRTIGKASQAGQMIGQQIGAGIGGGRGYLGQVGGGVGNAAGGLGRAIGGDIQYQYIPGEGWKPMLGKPGLRQLLAKKPIKKPPDATVGSQ